MMVWEDGESAGFGRVRIFGCLPDADPDYYFAALLVTPSGVDWHVSPMGVDDTTVGGFVEIYSERSREQAVELAKAACLKALTDYVPVESVYRRAERLLGSALVGRSDDREIIAAALDEIERLRA
jgi:hypothetical protein